MDFKLLLLLSSILLVHASSTSGKDEGNLFTPESEEDYYNFEEENYNSEEQDDEDKFRLNDKHLKLTIPNQNDKQADEQTEIPEAKYEVTELVDDIPNNTTVSGPVFANFTVAIPLNNVTIANISSIDNMIDNNDKKILASAKRNYISIFHIKAEYDNNKPEITVIQNNKPSFPGLQGFRDYLKGVRQGIINGIQSFVNNNNYSNNNGEVPVNNVNGNNNQAPDVHNIVNAPVVFWNKLQGRTSDFTGRRNVIV
ncbi:hypothetical protein O0L34_g14205 [Tuta absoluta]|nr:hypothetical protein O0L34_g14205 [Tuta absoluta]